MDLFNWAESERLKTESIDSTEAANQEWVNIATQAICNCAQRLYEFTTDDVWQVLDSWGAPPPKEARAMGAAMRAAARDCLIEATDRTRKSKRPACHRRPLAVWRVVK